MVDQPWQGDACSLVDEFRAGRRSPAEEAAACLAAIEASALNATSFVDADAALQAAAGADVSLPFGGVPIGVKQLEPLAGWPFTEGSLVFADRVAAESSTMMTRLVGPGGAVPLAQTTASEFGGLNVSVNRLNGVTHNPWRHGRSAGGSSGGSAAAVAGGLLPLATGGDGGGSIRIPAGYNGLVGMKGTYGRIPRGPHTTIHPNTIVLGCLARSVRDAARYFDVCAGYDPTDPTSLPSPGGWERGLGGQDLRGRRVIVEPALGGIPLAPGVEERIREAADALIADLDLQRVELPLELPRLGFQWVMGNVATLLGDLGERWPSCASAMTDEVRTGVYLSQALYNLRVAADAEQERTRANDAMAAAFADADLIICATNPDPAFDAAAPMSDQSSPLFEWARSTWLGRRATPAALGVARVGAGAWPGLPPSLLRWASEQFEDLLHMGALTMVSNLCGNPAVSIPVGHVDGLPIGMQVLARHHADPLLLDVALAVERERPWPLVASGAPH
jgi:Asp-tRNA(Asn)/Glu-tRNA(Gln) amidotransferase A subunit family amidase